MSAASRHHAGTALRSAHWAGAQSEAARGAQADVAGSSACAAGSQREQISVAGASASGSLAHSRQPASASGPAEHEEHSRSCVAVGETDSYSVFAAQTERTLLQDAQDPPAQKCP